MKTMRSLLPLLPALALGCAEWDNLESPFADDDFGDGGVAASCAALDGTFAADSLEFTALDDSGLFEDFGGVPAFTTDLDFAGQGFTSTLTVDGQPFTTTGTFEAFDDRLVFHDPFIWGMSGGTTLDCVFDGDQLSLSGDAGFDFVDDGFDGFADTSFGGTLTPAF